MVGVTAAAIGFAFDAGSGSKELSAFFSTCYIAGCLIAVLVVRRSGLFTAVIQPPLILFVAVPGAYFLFHGSEIGGIKDLAINCGYPLIERFPLMFFTSAIVLLFGAIRWFTTRGQVGVANAEDDEHVDASADGTAVDAVDAALKRRRRREHTVDRPSRATAAAAADSFDDAPARPRRPRTASGAAAGTSRSRHTRPPETELDPPAARPRRRPPVGAPVDPVDEPRRRPRAAAPREPREPRDPRAPRRNLPPMDPHERRERAERRDRPDRAERPRRRPTGYESREPREPRESYDPYEQFGPAEPRSTNGAGGTHHPVSRVRYRGADDGEARTEYRSRPRRRHAAPDSWDYDG